MSIVKDESRKVFILTKQEDLFNSIRNWFREDFHSIQAKSIFDIHSFIQKGLHAGLIMIDTEMDDLPGLCRKIRKIFSVSPIVLLPTEETKKQNEGYLEINLADLIITHESLFFGSKHIILFALDTYTKSMNLLYMQKEKNDLHKLISVLKNKSQSNLSFENDALFKSFMQLLYEFPFDFEVLYFSNHLRTTALLIKSLAEELSLDNDQIVSAIVSNFILQYILNSMPIHLIVLEPEEMPKEYQFEFFSLFLKKISPLKNIKEFHKVYHYLQQVWEHYDGTGYPLKLSGNTINEVSQIILIANKYHNYSSKLSESDLREIIMLGHKTFDIEEVGMKFDFANKTIMHQSSIFAPEIVHALRNNINEKTNFAFIPPHQEIIMKSEFDYKCLEVFNYIAKKKAEKEGGITEIIHTETSEQISESNKSHETESVHLKNTKSLKKSDNDNTKSNVPKGLREKHIGIELLEAGHHILEPIRNKNGQTIMQAGTIVTNSTSNFVKRMLERGVIDASIEIKCREKDP